MMACLKETFVSFHGCRRTAESDKEESEAPVSKLVYTTLEGIHAPFKFAPWNRGRIISFKNQMVPWLQENTLPEEFFKDMPLPIANVPNSSNGPSVAVFGGKSSRRKQLTTL